MTCKCGAILEIGRIICQSCNVAHYNIIMADVPSNEIEIDTEAFELFLDEG